MCEGDRKTAERGHRWILVWNDADLVNINGT